MYVGTMTPIFLFNNSRHPEIKRIHPKKFYSFGADVIATALPQISMASQATDRLPHHTSPSGVAGMALLCILMCTTHTHPPSIHTQNNNMEMDSIIK